MKALLIDAGNTRIRLKAWPGRTGRPAAEPDDAGAAAPLKELAVFDTAADPREWLELADGFRGGMPAGLVSVVPAVTERLLRLWPDLVVCDHRSTLPFSLDVEEPSAVGPDRLCNAAAASGAGLNDAIVVDAGTATTFDVLEGGVFRGGLIAPGMAFAARKLGESAARLSPVPFQRVPLKPGRNTAEAMATGAWHVGVGGVESVIAGLSSEFPDAQVVLTGGLAEHLDPAGRIVDLDWTLRGAAVLAGFAGCRG